MQAWQGVSLPLPHGDGFFQRQPDVGLAELRGRGELLGSGAFGGMRPERVAPVAGRQDQRGQCADTLGGDLQAVQPVDKRRQRVQCARQIVLDGFLGVFAVGVIQRRNALQHARAGQPGPPCDFSGAFHVFRGSQFFPAFAAAVAFVDASVGGFFAFAPQEGLGRNFLIAGSARREIQGLEMVFELFLPLARKGQVCDGGVEL